MLTLVHVSGSTVACRPNNQGRDLEVPLCLEGQNSSGVFGCTVVMAARGGHILVGNNEDRNHPQTVVTFLPGTKSYYGRVIFGYDDMLVQGRSLLSLMKTGKLGSELEPAFSERIPGDSPWMRSLRTQEYSYIFKEDKQNGTNTHLFFDLRRDPGEKENLRVADGRLRALFSQIQFLLEEGRKPGKVQGEQEPDAETLEILRTLGYIK